MDTLQLRLDHLVDGLAVSQKRKKAAEVVAAGLSYSPVHARRLFKQVMGESPAAFRRRLLLERASEKLSGSDAPVWKIASEAGYAGTEAFARSFERHYRLKPSAYRRSSSSPHSPQNTWLPAPNTFHYWRGCIVRSMRQGKTRMNLTQRLVDHDLGLTETILEQVQALTSEQLDAPLVEPLQLLVFEGADQTLREVLDSLVFTKEVWLSAIQGREIPMDRDKSTGALITRFKAVSSEFRTFVTQLEAEAKWDDAFVDALCTPPQTFSFGAVIAHILTFSAVRRTLALRELRRYGLTELGFGDPIEWERGEVSLQSC